MRELWASESYELHGWSLPFALAPAALLIVIAYTAVMRGGPRGESGTGVRAWLLAHCLCLLPYATVVMLSPSIVERDVAQTWFRIAAAFIPLAAATGTGLQLALTRHLRRYRRLVMIGVASACAWLVSPLGGLTIDGLQRIEGGMWFPRAGSLAWLALLHTLVLAIGGSVTLAYVAITSRPTEERRQLRYVLAANLVTYSGLVDVGLAYGIGVIPLGWLLSSIGTLLVVRALVVEDLLRVRAVDTTAPMLVMHVLAGALLGLVVIELLGPSTPWWVEAITLLVCFASVRASIATVGLVGRRTRGDDGPLDRLLAQLVARARALTDDAAISQLAIDVIELATGARAEIVIAVDPVVSDWLSRRRGAVFRGEADELPAGHRERVAAWLEAHRARLVVPVRVADRIVAVIAVPADRRPLRGRALAFLERAAERLAEALLHARMVQRAAERATIARDVELAAAVQGELVPREGPHVYGDVVVVGSWRPATRCAGDVWAVYPLDAGRVLVVIGDVAGHGVASAMVAAAATGACDVCVRRATTTLDLEALTEVMDAAVRRVGGGELAMTCFAGVLDPAAGEIEFVSCGQTSPFVCRADGDRIALSALVGRGSPLGAHGRTPARTHRHRLGRGDLVVWYTDGVIEAHDPAGAPFGDRRLRRTLASLSPSRRTPSALHELLVDQVTAHRGGRPPDDDETLVIAQIGPQVGAA